MQGLEGADRNAVELYPLWLEMQNSIARTIYFEALVRGLSDINQAQESFHPHRAGALSKTLAAAEFLRETFACYPA